MLTAWGSSGSSSSSSADTTATVTTVGLAAATEVTDQQSTNSAGSIPTAFVDCMKNNGVVLPDGALPGAQGANGGTPSLPEGVDAGAFQKAMAACRSELPAGLGLPGGANGPDLSAFFTCLRDNGVTVKDNATPGEIPTDDPAFATASETCKPLLPDGLGARLAGKPNGATPASPTPATPSTATTPSTTAA